MPRSYEVKATIREYEPLDDEAVVRLSLGAWEPVFAAVEELLGSELFIRLRGDWRASQAREVRDVLADPHKQVRVAELAREAIGFVAAKSGFAPAGPCEILAARSRSAVRQRLAA